MDTPDFRRILVIDDNPAIHEDFRKILLQGDRGNDELAALEADLFGAPAKTGEIELHFDVESAFQGREGCEKARQALIDQRPFALAFVDMRMPPGWDGLETIRHLFEIDSDIQVVVCTAHSDYSWAQMLEKLGMTDRVLLLKKPFDNLEIRQLAAALTEKWKLKRQAELKVGELEAMVHARTHQLREQALHDRLTGLPNRAYILEKLGEHARSGSSETKAASAILFVDCDRFKIINDSLGHDIGDDLLLEISVRLRSLLHASIHERNAGENSFVGRLAGDEFIVFLDRLAGSQAAHDFASRLIEALGVPYLLKGYEVQSHASVGVVFNLASYQNAEDLIRDGDLAMYAAKRAGGRRQVQFDIHMREIATLRLNLEHDLRRALHKDELFLVYQPIIELDSGRLHGFEALVRWNHPTRGLLMPGEFIPVAEDSNLIIPLGQRILDGACRQLADWRRRFPASFRHSVSVNLSQQHFNDPELVEFLKASLRKHAIPPGALKLEMTESAIMTNLREGRSLMEQIAALGVELYMDDFGTGYSSLHCLHGLPMQCLKIDRSFIVTLTLKRDYAAIISAIVQLAHNLGMQVVAEGVETREQVVMLQALECDRAQGFFISKPLSVEDVEGHLSRDDGVTAFPLPATRATALGPSTV